ncbi:MAG: DUF305 domain-containing protein [Gemmatimonadota bacterium]
MTLLALGATAACAGTSAPPAASPAPAGPRANEAAVAFMSGMIHHHAQALVMAEWAASHDASPTIQTLSGRIFISQTDEIGLMQTWLQDVGEPVPEPNPRGMRMVMNGIEHDMLMPGMLTDAQLEELDRARGAEFDRLFITFMIQHHYGAISMVETLFASHGGTADERIYKFASDVFADQTSEIDRMENMLALMAPAAARP